MEHEKRLMIVKDGIHWLEKRAKLDSAWVHPNEQEIFLSHYQLQMEYMRVDKSEVTSTDLNSNAKNQDMSKKEPSVFINYHNRLREYEENKMYRERNKTKIVKENQKNFFKPAEKSMELNKEAIIYWNKGDKEQTLKLLERALQTYPKIKDEEFQITNGAYLSIIFNLGIGYFNNGYLEEGFEYFSLYHQLTEDGDFLRDTLKAILQMEASYHYKNKWVTANYKGIVFRKDGTDITIEMNDVKTYKQINLPFKQPVCLNVELKNNTTPKLLDYFYLHELISENNEKLRYEVMLPLNKITIFLEEFYTKNLKNENISFKLIKDFELLTAEFLMAENREKTRILHEYPEMEAHHFKSIVFIDVNNAYKESFLENFRHFIKHYVAPQLTDIEEEENELKALKQDYENLVTWFRSRLKEEFLYIQQHHRDVAGIYADLKAVEYNLLSGQKDLFGSFDKSLYKNYKLEYMQLVEPIFAEENNKKKDKKNEMDINAIESINFKNYELKTSLNCKWKTMYDLVEIDTIAVLAKIRLFLEEILSYIVIQEEVSLYKGDNRKTPSQMAEDIEVKTGKELCETLKALHNKSNESSHFDIAQSEYIPIEQESYTTTIEQLKLLKKTTIELVGIFKL